MKSFNFNLETELAVLERYNLTPNELFLTRILLILQDDKDADILARYLNISGIESIKNTLISLQNKGVILKSYKIKEGRKFEPLDVEFNKNFVKNIYRASLEMGSELFDHYPQFATINGNIVPIRSISKKFSTLEDALRYYEKTIKWNPEIHKEIIELLDWASTNTNFINCTLASFIIDRKWNDIQALKNGDMVNVNFDAVKMI